MPYRNSIISSIHGQELQSQENRLVEINSETYKTLRENSLAYVYVGNIYWELEWNDKELRRDCEYRRGKGEVTITAQVRRMSKTARANYSHVCKLRCEVLQ